ncbi:MAG: cupin domain-containing protein [Peptococcaceae bacterium]|nr:cupin domain-containing protein [Peptococcaceae bacterium]
MIRKKENQRIEYREDPFGGQGTIAVRYLAEEGDHGNEKYNMLSRVTIPPGVSVGLHSHPGKTESLYILAGNCRYTDQGEHVLQAGDTAIVRGQDSHRLVSLGPEPLEYIAVIVLD